MMTVAAARALARRRRLLRRHRPAVRGVQPRAADARARASRWSTSPARSRRKPTVLPLSIGDGELCETALTTVSVPEMFQYWLQGGRITVGFLGGAQIDRFGNLNSTVIGDVRRSPKVRLPGSGGAHRDRDLLPSASSSSCATPAAPSCDRLAFVTSLGHGPTGRERRALGLATEGPVLLVTDLCIDAPAPGDEGVRGDEPAPRRDPRAGRRADRLAGGDSPATVGSRLRRADGRELEALPRPQRRGPAAAHGVAAEQNDRRADMSDSVL